MTIAQFSELITALYTVASIVGHLNFLPPAITNFCNKIALNLKGSK